MNANRLRNVFVSHFSAFVIIKLVEFLFNSIGRACGGCHATRETIGGESGVEPSKNVTVGIHLEWAHLVNCPCIFRLREIQPERIRDYWRVFLSNGLGKFPFSKIFKFKSFH